MESFGSGIARESVFCDRHRNEFKTAISFKRWQAENGVKIDSPIAEIDENLSPFKKWLVDIKYGAFRRTSHGNVCGIPEKDRVKLLHENSKASKPPTLLEAKPPNIEEINDETCSNDALDLNDESSDNNNALIIAAAVNQNPKPITKSSKTLTVPAKMPKIFQHFAYITKDLKTIPTIVMYSMLTAWIWQLK
ncbi:hypothetical protein PVAND_000117 [Polypedilum vanderplanki]|uniref:Uncharacterized protein n=1 Tax=Polypedilum vanderplanki TaxID=319348 RepID=A0A9J6BJE4_POLVA|nr:hypothetical protein PVAND_000117 [Polypedilum vanderplanki]